MPIADPSPVIEREWIVTNGIGAYSSGTIAGVLTRRYHGLLVAALDPPLGRTVLVAKLDDSISFGEDPVPLFANQWGDAQTPPHQAVPRRRRGRSTRPRLRRSVPGRSELERTVLFYEYCSGDIAAGLGASHQTGWTGLVGTLLQDQGEEQ